MWGVGIERHLYTLRRHTLAVLPEGSTALRVLHVSDAHLAPWQHGRQAWIASLAELAPDLVVNTGDNLGHPDALDAVRRSFSPFAGIPGLFVHGSNDVFGPAPRNPLLYFAGPSTRRPMPTPLDTASLDRFLVDDLGWHDLDNAAATVDAAGLRIDALGTGDAHMEWDEPDALPPLRAAQRAAGDPDLVLGVTHAPYRRVLDELTDLGADVLLAGHTHGGQVRVPFAPRALVANCDLPLDQARGLSTWEHDGRRVPLNVSAGIGHSIYAPVRFACRPEASLLTLVPRR
ncbi:MAG: metallophosphoesterase [Microbacterium sp.]